MLRGKSAQLDFNAVGVQDVEAFNLAVVAETGNFDSHVLGQPVGFFNVLDGIELVGTMAAVAEHSHDESGIVWPISVAPFEAVVTVINPKNAAAADAGGALYDGLVAEGIDVLLDDRDERPGVKFKDAELIGIPYRITVGPKGLAEGIVEVTRRRGKKSHNVAVEKAAAAVAEAILEERSFSPGF